MAPSPVQSTALNRTVPIARHADVLVVGGGPAGVAAAASAARAGAQVLLLEQSGMLGGVTTSNLYLRMSTLQGRSVDYAIVGGVAQEWVDRVLAAKGGTLREGSITFDLEIAKRAWDQLALDAGVEVLFNTTAFDATLHENGIRSVVALNKSGLQAFSADVVVDCSGDGDVAARAGAPFEIGRASDGLTQPVTTMMRFGGVDMAAFDTFVARDTRLRETMARAAANGDFELYQDHLCSILYWRGRPDVVSFNVTHITHVDATDAVQLSAAEMEGRRQVWILHDFLKQYVDGFESAWLIDTAPHVGVRETRRFVGEYVLTGEDVMHGHEPPDTIALGSYGIDIHNPHGVGVTFIHIQAAAYGIPYRCLVPLQVENLLVAGRILSATHEALASARVMLTCMATGQAAGVAAAMASQRSVLPRHIDVARLQEALLEQGAILRSAQARELDRPATIATEADLADWLFHTRS
jgi:hypothetical protein